MDATVLVLLVTIILTMIGLHLQMLIHVDKRLDRIEDLLIQHITNTKIHQEHV